jgi:hypothetical protein
MDVSSLQIRRLPPAPCPERNEVALLLAEAFDDSPLFRSAFPRPKVRSAALGFLFRALLADAARYGRADTASTDRIVGALLWYLPGGYPIPMARALRSLPRYLQLIGCSPSGALKLCRAQAALDRLRPTQPHCHGHFMAARADAGVRINAVLGRRMLEEADANDWPVYLETQDRRAVDLYRRLGFEVSSSGVEILPGGPPTWTMWRRPRSPNAAPAP